jgi:predicted RNase H-like nuclease (RuvC/YqgF family)
MDREDKIHIEWMERKFVEKDEEIERLKEENKVLRRANDALEKRCKESEAETDRVYEEYGPKVKAKVVDRRAQLDNELQQTVLDVEARVKLLKERVEQQTSAVEAIQESSASIGSALVAMSKNQNRIIDRLRRHIADVEAARVQDQLSKMSISLPTTGSLSVHSTASIPDTRDHGTQILGCCDCAQLQHAVKHLRDQNTRFIEALRVRREPL